MSKIKLQSNLRSIVLKSIKAAKCTHVLINMILCLLAGSKSGHPLYLGSQSRMMRMASWFQRADMKNSWSCSWCWYSSCKDLFVVTGFEVDLVLWPCQIASLTSNSSVWAAGSFKWWNLGISCQAHSSWARGTFAVNLSNSSPFNCMNITFFKPPEPPKTCGWKMELMKLEWQVCPS